MVCKRCDSPKMTEWKDLSDEQKFLVERLPSFEDMTLSQIKRSRYCTRCWFREEERAETFA